jgi:hypothetical protein
MKSIIHVHVHIAHHCYSVSPHSVASNIAHQYYLNELPVYHGLVQYQKQ